MFTLAVDRVLTKDQRDAKKKGEDVVSADFPQFVVFGDSAKSICDWFSKGKPIQIQAEFQSYKKDDGNNGTTYGSNFVVRTWGFVPKDTSDDSGNNNSNSGSKSGNKGSSSGNSNGNGHSTSSGSNSSDYEVPDDEIPF
jgi:single-stranded DNA-binding protein